MRKIPRLRLFMNNNVRYMAALTCIERLTELQRSCQQVVAFLSFFYKSAKWFFNWSDLSVGIRGLKQFCYNVVITFPLIRQCWNNLTIANYGWSIVAKFNKIILIQRIIYIFNEMIFLIQRIIYIFNKLFTYSTKETFLFNQLNVFIQRTLWSIFIQPNSH